MDSKQAKEYLELQKARFIKTMAPEMLLATNEAISALGKQVPEKPIIKNELYCCPCCGDNYMLLVGDKRCGECGQLLDWSDMVGHKSNLAPKMQSNYERIKNMSIEEMHAFLIELDTNRMMFGMAFRNLPETEGLSYNDEIKVWLESEYNTTRETIYSSAEKLTKKFIEDGWTKDTCFSEFTLEEAERKGCLFIITGIKKGRKYFKMNVCGNIYDDRGNLVFYDMETVRNDESEANK